MNTVFDFQLYHFPLQLFYLLLLLPQSSSTMNVKIIYGSDTGNTDYVIETYLLNELSIHFNEVNHVNIYNIEAADWLDDVLFIIGVPRGMMESFRAIGIRTSMNSKIRL